jgi:hypothetical protein
MSQELSRPPGGSVPYALATDRRLWVLSALIALVLVATRWRFHYAASVDWGLHYGLANFLFTRFMDPGASDAFLGFMASYPPAAHWLAALSTFFTGSTLVSMNVVALLATFAAYALMAALLTEGRGIADLAALGVFSALCFALAHERAAFGYQVILNYFYPQLVGEALVLAAVAWLATGALTRMVAWKRWIAAFAITWVLCAFQPLAAVEFGAIAVLFAFLEDMPEGRTGGWGRAITAAVPMAAAVGAGIAGSPFFWLVSRLAANQGWLSFGRWMSAYDYQPLVLAAVVASLGTVLLARRGLLPRSKAFALASMSMAGAALIVGQTMALRFAGVGSLYAVSKYVFFTGTACALCIAYGVQALVSRRAASARWKLLDGAGPLIVPLFGAVGIFIVTSGALPWRHTLQPTLDYQGVVRTYLRDGGVPAAAGASASRHGAHTIYENYVVTFGDLRLPVKLLPEAVLNSVPTGDAVQYVLMPTAGDYEDVVERCSVGRRFDLSTSALNRRCFVESSARLPENRPVRVALGSRGAGYLRDGWSAPEGWGTWTKGAKSVLEFVRAAPPDGAVDAVRLRYTAFLAPGRPSQTFRVLADGVEAGRFTTSSGDVAAITVNLGREERHTIELQVENPVSPKELGLSHNDDRKLGIGVVDVELLPGGKAR